MMKSVKTLGLYKKFTKFDRGLGARLPEAYKKFYQEWQLTQPTAIHYVPAEGKWKRDPVTGEVHPIQNIPIPLKYPREYHQHMWGGEGVVQGFQKRSKLVRRVPHFWVPNLKRSVVYSEVLDKHISVIVTDKLISQIHANYGFDHYLLKTPACDLKSLLPLSLKRKILQDLANGCPAYTDKPDKQTEVLNRYQKYLSTYTPEEIEWYGYSFDQACDKLSKSIEDAEQPVPLKHLYRAEFIEKLKAAEQGTSENTQEITETASWIQRINPFGKKRET